MLLPEGWAAVLTERVLGQQKCLPIGQSGSQVGTMAAHTHRNSWKRHGCEVLGCWYWPCVCRCLKGRACVPHHSLHLPPLLMLAKVGCWNELHCSVLQDRKEKDSFFNWFYFAINFGSLLAVTTLVYIQVSCHAGHAGRLRLQQRSVRPLLLTGQMHDLPLLHPIEQIRDCIVTCSNDGVGPAGVSQLGHWLRHSSCGHGSCSHHFHGRQPQIYTRGTHREVSPLPFFASQPAVGLSNLHITLHVRVSTICRVAACRGTLLT